MRTGPAELVAGPTAQSARRAKTFHAAIWKGVFPRPVSQGAIDLSNLLSVTMKLYFPLNRPTDVTDE